jgi:hypothetical protein
MARVEPGALSEKGVELVFIAGSVPEAERVEALLGENGIDFAVELQQFIRPGLFSSFDELTGAGFSVISGQAAFCRSLLRERGLTQGIVSPDE